MSPHSKTFSVTLSLIARIRALAKGFVVSFLHAVATIADVIFAVVTVRAPLCLACSVCMQCPPPTPLPHFPFSARRRTSMSTTATSSLPKQNPMRCRSHACCFSSGWSQKTIRIHKHQSEKRKKERKNEGTKERTTERKTERTKERKKEIKK